MIAFSWKEAKKEAIKHMKYRIGIYEKGGRNMEATRLKEKLARFVKDEQ